ncbi:MAG: hypothetical protein GY716_18085 [bacterium]|nr:hypothetical protein [bacterium]
MIPSATLYDAVDPHGHTIFIDSLICQACYEAILLDDFCDEHGVGYVDGRAYYSNLAYYMHRGRSPNADDPLCPACRESPTGDGWCEACGIGVVGKLRFDDRSSYDRMLQARRTLQQALDRLGSCELCAAAMVAIRGRCPEHRIHYRDGKGQPDP